MTVSMTPTANHFDDSIDGIRAKVADQFSRQVIEGAAHALHSKGNPLRLTFFSTAMRMLFEHLMDTLAPSDRVRDCVWFQAQTENGRPTRRQRIMYAIQGGLTDEFVKEELDVDPEPLRKALLAAIDALSKHIHGRETSIINERAEQDAFAEATLAEMEAFLDAMRACRDAVLSPISDELDDAAVDALLSETILAVDELASHYSVEEIYVDTITVDAIGPDRVTFRATGSIAVVLQWGSNSDLRRGDGAEMEESFPFWCDIVLPIESPWDLLNAETEYCIDTREWFGNRYDE